MKHTAWFLMIGVALLTSRDSALASPEDKANPSTLNLLGDRRLAVGARLGIFPPIGIAAEVTVRPFRHFAVNGYGMYLPGGVNVANRGRQFTLGGNFVMEMAEGRRGGLYFSLGVVYYHYHAFKDPQSFYETSVTVPLTGGYLFKSKGFELQVGAGPQFFAVYEVPPCTGWICIRGFIPPVLPAFDLALRYAF